MITFCLLHIRKLRLKEFHELAQRHAASKKVMRGKLGQTGLKLYNGKGFDNLNICFPSIVHKILCLPEDLISVAFGLSVVISTLGKF